MSLSITCVLLIFALTLVGAVPEDHSLKELKKEPLLRNANLQYVGHTAFSGSHKPLKKDQEHPKGKRIDPSKKVQKKSLAEMAQDMAYRIITAEGHVYKVNGIEEDVKKSLNDETPSELLVSRACDALANATQNLQTKQKRLLLPGYRRIHHGSSAQHPLFSPNAKLGNGCSGTYIGARFVLTAAHCLYDPETSDFIQINHVAPGFDGYARLGYRYHEWYFVPERWIRRADEEYDYAVVRMRTSFDYWYQFGLNDIDTIGPGTHITIMGYPFDMGNGRWQVQSSGRTAPEFWPERPELLYHVESASSRGNDGGAVFTFYKPPQIGGFWSFTTLIGVQTGSKTICSRWELVGIPGPFGGLSHWPVCVEEMATNMAVRISRRTYRQICSWTDLCPRLFRRS